MNEKTAEQRELVSLLNAARSQGLVESQKEFADMIQLHPGYLSQLIKGTKSITKQMLKRIRDAVAAAGVVIEGNGNATATGPNSSAQVVSGDVSALIAELAEQRKAYVDQLRAKDLQIAECMQLLKDAIAKSKK
ncbi:MAG: helix-turn-helix transcriptional regulator [Paludibacteraceae bacterium]|nr:helix-turn-helix transcriptional regulator [Paludibacteraceae bacterium]